MYAWCPECSVSCTKHLHDNGYQHFAAGGSKCDSSPSFCTPLVRPHKHRPTPTRAATATATATPRHTDLRPARTSRQPTPPHLPPPPPSTQTHTPEGAMRGWHTNLRRHGPVKSSISVAGEATVVWDCKLCSGTKRRLLQSVCIAYFVSGFCYCHERKGGGGGVGQFLYCVWSVFRSVGVDDLLSLGAERTEWRWVGRMLILKRRPYISHNPHCGASLLIIRWIVLYIRFSPSLRLW